jgi:2-polyprenyl-3-methyl-5-hydroxy-6-metoxy-1,4-benzoquinol methylase
MKCRHCASPVDLPFIDLGSAPPSNAYLSEADLHAPEKWYPLRVLVCTQCWLVQTQDYAHFSDLFSAEYAYFSSFSTSWLEHAKCYVDAMAKRFHLSPESRVLEIAANDGYLLQYVRAKGIPCLGIEPTASTAAAARSKGLEIVEEFFGTTLACRLAEQGWRADLIAANNVLAHVPDINDFVSGFYQLLKPEGAATFECPHLLNLVQQNQFDTIYHEHFSYLSLSAVSRIFERNGLSVFDVEEIPTHGGSLRVFAQIKDRGRRPVEDRVETLMAQERHAGIETPAFYQGFQARADTVKNDLLDILINARRSGKKVAAYGAAAKGNTLLNYAGVRRDLIAFVVDRNPVKQGRFLPGSRIPIVGEDRLQSERPDFVVILPWNLVTELKEQTGFIKSWGGRFVTAVPTLEVQ